MKTPLPALALLALASPALADEPKPALAPSEIVEAAPAADWVTIAPSDLLVMDLAPDRDGAKRRVVIELMPPPFSQGWIGNIRKLAAAHWWDGAAITRVQDNYVVQWGDPNADDKAKAKALPPGLVTVPESAYSVDLIDIELAAFGEERTTESEKDWRETLKATPEALPATLEKNPDIVHTQRPNTKAGWHERDSYAEFVQFEKGWPLGVEGNGPDTRFWPVHCYGMVGVGRDMSPDTGTGAELYTVIGQAPRHLDRNIALVGRVIEGMEYLSSLPRGHGPLGLYEKPEQRVPIASIRLGNEVPGLPAYQYLSTESGAFAKYADARANRRDPFFIVPAGGVDICNVPVPIRHAP